MSDASAAKSPLLFRGILSVHRMGAEPDRPYLVANSWCCVCRIRHSFSWPEDNRTRDEFEINLPCDDPEFKNRPAFLELDPDQGEKNRKTFNEFRSQLSKWKQKGRLCDPLWRYGTYSEKYS